MWLNRLLRELDILSMDELGVLSAALTGVVSQFTVFDTGLYATFAVGVVYCRIERLWIGVDANPMLFIGEESDSKLGVVTGKRRGEDILREIWKFKNI